MPTCQVMYRFTAIIRLTRGLTELVQKVASHVGFRDKVVAVAEPKTRT